MKFEEWMQEVDALLEDETGGLDSSTLPDQPYADYFEDGLSPEEVVRFVLDAET